VVICLAQHAVVYFVPLTIAGTIQLAPGLCPDIEVE